MRSFHNPTRVLFSDNALDSLGDIVNGQQVLLVTTPGFRERGAVTKVQGSLFGRHLTVLDRVSTNPDMDDLDVLAGECSNEAARPDCIIALGGGSAIDTAKVLSRTIGSESDTPLSDCFRKGIPLDERGGVPIVAIPTTAGTGSEVTCTATIWDFREGAKYSLSGEDLFPRTAIIDPTLTYGLPPDITASSGLDAVSHAFESIWNTSANPVSIALASESLRFSFDALPKLRRTGDDHEARSDMMNASLLAGLAISQTRTALAHSISYPLTLKLGIPHGIACSFALPEILDFNVQSDDGRLARLAGRLGCDSPPDLVTTLRRMLNEIPLFRRYLGNGDIRDKVAGLQSHMSMKGRIENNLRHVRHGDLDLILRKAIDRYNNDC